MKRFYITAFAIIFAALLLSGCVTYDQELYIGKNGSGIVKVHYSLINVDTGSEMGSEVDVIPASFSTNEAEIREMYKGDGIELKDIKIESDETITNVYLLIKFDNVLDLNDHGVWDENQVIGTRIEDGKLVYIQDISNPDARTLSSEEKSLYDSYIFSYSLQLPNKVIETNGLRSKDGRTIYWEYPLSIVESNSHLQMHASCEAPPGYKSSRSGGTGGFLGGISFLLALICCAVVFVILIIILLIVLLKRKKKPSIPQTQSEKPSEVQSDLKRETEEPKPDVSPGSGEPKTENELTSETDNKPDIVEEENIEAVYETEKTEPPIQEAEVDTNKPKFGSDKTKKETTDGSFD